MLPDFLVVGAQKAASSWLSEGLGEHPEIFMLPREGNFFNIDDNFNRGVEWYRAQFDGRRDELRCGEGTPGYMFKPRFAERIKSVLGPDVQLLGCLRNPVDRAYSAFWMMLTGGRIDPNAKFVDFFRDSNVDGIRTRGLYHQQLNRLARTFRRENMHFLVMELDLKDGPATLRRCYEFLGVNPDFVAERAGKRANANKDFRVGHSVVAPAAARVARVAHGLPRVLRVPLRSGYLGLLKLLPKRRAYAPLSPETRAALMEPYLDDVRRLEEFLERDLSVWYEPRDLSGRR